MSRQSLKERLATFLKRHYSERFIPSGDLQRIVAEKTNYTPQNVGRRLRELENEGVVEVQYRKGHAYYRFKVQPTMDEITQQFAPPAASRCRFLAKTQSMSMATNRPTANSTATNGVPNRTSRPFSHKGRCNEIRPLQRPYTHASVLLRMVLHKVGNPLRPRDWHTHLVLLDRALRRPLRRRRSRTNRQEERVRCHQCHGRFGLVRCYATQPLGGTLSFCSKKCKDDFHKSAQERERIKQFFLWLHSHGPPSSAR